MIEELSISTDRLMFVRGFLTSWASVTVDCSDSLFHELFVGNGKVKFFGFGRVSQEACKEDILI